MLVTFKSKAYNNITMLGDVAIRLIKMMGESGTVPSAIVAEDVPEALARLQSALKHSHTNGSTDSQDEEEPDVSLERRAFPLIELLSHAVKEKSNVMWDKG